MLALSTGRAGTDRPRLRALLLLLLLPPQQSRLPGSNHVQASVVLGAVLAVPRAAALAGPIAVVPVVITNAAKAEAEGVARVGAGVRLLRHGALLRAAALEGGIGGVVGTGRSVQLRGLALEGTAEEGTAKEREGERAGGRER